MDGVSLQKWRPARWLAATALVLALLSVGCSGGWSYQLLAWYVDWTLRDYVQFEGDVHSEYEQRLETLLRWHQGTQLPRYADWLRHVKRLTREDRIELTRWQREGEQLGVFWHDLMQRVVPHATVLLAQLDDGQVEQLIHNLEAKTRDIEREYDDRDREERREHRARRLQKQVERWTGPLHEPQQVLIQQWASSVIDLSDASIANRRHWTRHLQQALQQRRDEVALQASLQILLVEPRKLWADAYLDGIQSNTRRTQRLLEDLHHSLDTRQRRRLAENLEEWARRLDRIADEA